ncbi:MAG: metal-dependent hydrolase [Pseudomonadota bacterium]
MDSLSQVVLGASVAGVCAPANHRGKAMLLGAGLGTLPDLDVFIDFGGAVENFTYHRGFSHSLFVLAPFSVLVWVFLRRCWSPVRDQPLRWLAAISLALLTHPLLDAHTAYGTQLFWPLDTPPTSWATLFIIDPMYTLPLLVGVALAAFRRQAGAKALRVGLIVSTLYVGWSWIAQSIVTRHVDDALASMQVQEAQVFVTPTPFNTLLWRVVVIDDENYLEGFDSLLVDEVTLRFESYTSGVNMLEETGHIWAVERLRWFARDFVKARIDNDRLVISDLRMGQEPFYVFSHVVAARGNPHWTEIPAELLPTSLDDRLLAETWDRIWRDDNAAIGH